MIIPTVEDDPLHFDASASKLITFPPPPEPSVSHPHMALENDGEVLVPDLVRSIFQHIV